MEMGVSSVVNELSAQIPLFACRNAIYDDSIQKDIERYLYCEKFNVPPYSGSYGDQPYRWMRMAFIIRHSLAVREAKEIKKHGNT